MDPTIKQTPQPIQPDSPGRKAALFLERTETRLKIHLKHLGQCAHFPFEDCCECGGKDLWQDLAALYAAATAAA